MVKGIAKVRPVLLVALLIYTSFSNIRAQTSLYEFDFKDISLKNAMQQIEKKTGYVFFFNNSSIDINRNIKVRLHNASLEDIVKELFPNYQYKIENRKIILLSQYIVENIDVSGIIVDQQGVPIAGASVIEKNDLNNGIISNLDGFFRMTVPQNATIVVTCIGYMTEEVKVKKSRSLTVKLEEDQRVLNEIVVVGYGQVKKQDLTGAVVNVKMSDVEDTPVMSVDQTLQGRLAGVDIMSTTGEPGAVTSIRIRGTRSISATNEPLIVVDGVIDAINDIADINSSDIESISVLKDASSTAIYGSRGSNGVIIITTKQGRKGKPEIIFRSDLGLAQLPRSLDLMNGAEFAQYRNDYEYFISGGTGTQPFPNPLSYGEGTDWVKEVTQTALYQNYALSLSGGTDATSYYGSFSFNNTEGIIKSSGMKRYTGRINLDYKLFSWMKIGINTTYTYRDQDVNVVTLGGTNWWNAAIYLSPLIDVGSDFNNYWYAGQKFNSPRALIDQNTDILEKHVTTNTGYLKFSPLKNLEIRNQATYYRHGAHRYKYEPGTLPAKAEDEGGTAYRGEYKEYSILSENTISYKMSLKEEHKFDFLMGFTAQKWGSENLTLQGKGYQVDQIKWNNLGAIYDKSNYTTTSTMEEITRMSILSRFNYNYQNRYYLTFSGRADGSSNFAKNHKWGLFPSAALKWNIYNEPFIRDAGWLNELSVRLSLGRTGNDGIPPYRSLSAQRFTSNGYLFNGAQPTASYPSRLASNDLTWEITDVCNMAFDLSLFRNRINITAEGYLSYTNDVLLYIPTPTHTGYSNIFANVGKTTNKGIEITFQTKNIIERDFSWSTLFSLSHNKQMVKDIGTSDFVAVYSAYGNNSYMMYGYVKDYPLNALWGFKYAGTWKNRDEIDRNEITRAYVSVSGLQKNPGYARYLDINHDGIMNERDLVYLGSADPWIYGGVQNTFNYRSLSFSIYFNYSLGGKIYNISEQWMGNGSPFTNQYHYMTEAWHPTRYPNSDIPRAGSIDAIASSRMVYDASYLRLKSLMVSYNFNVQEKLRFIKDVKISLSGDNLYLWKKYNGFDPDVSSNSESSTLRRVDIGAYPKPRTVILSVQLKY